MLNKQSLAQTVGRPKLGPSKPAMPSRSALLKLKPKEGLGENHASDLTVVEPTRNTPRVYITD